MSRWRHIKGVFGCVFLAGAAVLLIWELLEAADTGAIRDRHLQLIVLAEDPEAFWLSAAMHVIGLVSGLGFFAVLLWGMAQERANAPKLDAWLRRRPENQLSPPPVRRPRSP